MRLVLLGLVLTACGSSPEDCRSYAKELSAMLSLAAEDPPNPVYVPDEVKLVERNDLPRQYAPYAKAIEILPTETRFDGQKIERTELARHLADELVARTEQQRRYPPRAGRPLEPRLVYLVIDARAPWPSVVDAVEAATYAGTTAMAFAFAMHQPLTLPPRAPIDDKLDAILSSPGNRASEMAAILKDQIRGCPGIDVIIEAAVTGDYDNKAQQLANAIPDALAHCACRVNKPDLRSSLFRLLYIPRPVRALHLDPSQPATAIKLPATAVWADAAKLLPATTRNVQFSVE
jgi:hypothetical protein